MKRSPREVFGHYLRDCRIAAGLTQKDVSDELGLKSAQSISNIERGMASPPIKVVKAMIHLYKVDEGEILWRLIELQVDQLQEKFYKTRRA